MEMIHENISNQLRRFLNRSIIAVFLDEQLRQCSFACIESTFFGEAIRIYFSEGELIEIITDNIPHFYGEGDLILNIEDNSYTESPISNMNTKKITTIKMFYWKISGINVLGPSKYFVQIEFFYNAELLLSVGFFYFDQSTKKMECLITGELSVGFRHGLSIVDYRDNLSVSMITISEHV